jgi:hypothetical protein
MQVSLLKNLKKKGKEFPKTELLGIYGKLMGIAKSINDKSLDKCVSGEGEKDKSHLTRVTHYILEPKPSVMCFNINWYDNQIPYMDILRFACSIP